MSRKAFFIVPLLCVIVSGHAQVLRDINYSYLYNASEQFSLNWKIINLDNRIEVYYQLEATSENQSLGAYSIQWDVRKELSEKEGKPITIPDNAPDTKRGVFALEPSLAGQILVAKVFKQAGNSPKVVTIFYKIIPSTVTPVLFQEGKPVTASYIQQNRPVSIRGFDSIQHLVVSYYADEFPAAGPAFATAQARVPARIQADSMFTITPGTPIAFTNKGLYLVQRDTASSVGLAFRVEDDYPKLGRFESLAGPMIYMCTKLEYDKLKEAGSDKSKFDKVVLNITGNTDRAKIFMRNYFRRVEQANVFFSSYKEGWKTDRGMIYIIFGPPEAVYLFDKREIWEYQNNNFRGRFIFVRSSTLFDPENFVLIRDKKYTDEWYQMIDLWRKARF